MNARDCIRLKSPRAKRVWKHTNSESRAWLVVLKSNSYWCRLGRLAWMRHWVFYSNRAWNQPVEMSSVFPSDSLGRRSVQTAHVVQGWLPLLTSEMWVTVSDLCSVLILVQSSITHNVYCSAYRKILSCFSQCWWGKNNQSYKVKQIKLFNVKPGASLCQNASGITRHNFHLWTLAP